jgi:hypothetical protein
VIIANLPLWLVFIVPTALMTGVAIAARLWISRTIAAVIVIFVAMAGFAILYSVVIDAYARLGESEGNGTVVTVFIIAIFWLMEAVVSLFLISRAGAAMQLGLESEK